MNLNDMRANAYQNSVKKDENKSKNENQSQSDDKKTVKPFVPAAFIKSSQLIDGKEAVFTEFDNGKAVTQSGTIKSFVPKSFNTLLQNDSTNENETAKKVNFSENTFITQPFSANQFSTNNQGKQPKENYNKKLDDYADKLKNGGLLKVPVEKPEPEGKDSVFRRVAKFLLLIGEDEAAKILPHLSQKHIEKIIPEIASIRSVSPEEATVILEEFNHLVEKEKASGGVETARDILTKAYGKTRAEQMLLKTMPVITEKPFTYLNDEEQEKILLLIKDENIGVQTLVLSNLEPQKAAGVINLMDAETKKAVVLRLAKMGPMNPEMVRRVDDAMKEKVANITTAKTEVVDGRNALAQILKKMNSGKENDIIATLSEDDPDLGDDLKSRLFTFEDIVNADDRFIQEKLREMKDSDIAYLIAGKTNQFQEKILYNVSSSKREEILIQSDILKPMRKDDVDRITNHFVLMLRKAYENGELIIKNRNDEEYV